MKNSIRLMMIAAAALAGSLAYAQPPPGERPPHDHMPPPHLPPLLDEDGPPRGEPGFQSASPLHRWMQELRENDPEEFRRLQELRISDPAEFRSITRDKMKQQGLTRLQKERPAVYDAVMGLSPEDRAWLADRLLRPGMEGGPMREHRPMPPGDGPRDRGDEMEIDRRLIRTYHGTANEEEKAQIRETLRSQLSMVYDRELEVRRGQLAEAEEKLSAIRTAINQGERGKEEFINRKLSAWLDQPMKRPPRD